MVPARFAVFFIALLMAGVHVAQAQEGTGDPRGIRRAESNPKTRGARGCARRGSGSPLQRPEAPLVKAGEVLVTNKPTIQAPKSSPSHGDIASGPTVDTILQRLAVPQPATAVASASATAHTIVAPVAPASGAAVDNIMHRLGGRASDPVEPLAAATTATPSDATVDAIQQRLASTVRTLKAPARRPGRGSGRQYAGEVR